MRASLRIAARIVAIAARNVARNRRRTLITFAAVFLSLTIMVGLRGFLNGLHSTLRQSVILGQTGALQVHGKGFARAVSNSLRLDVPADDAFLERVKAVPGVREAAARIAFGGMVSTGDTTAFAILMAIDPRREGIVCPRRMEAVSAGRPLDGAAPATGALVTPELLGALGLGIGGKAALLTGDRDGVMNALEVTVTGVYGQPGLPLPEKKIAFVPLGLAQELLRMEARATEIAVAVDAPDRPGQIERVREALQAALGPDYEVTTWHDAAAFVDEAVATQNAVLSVVAGIFLFVALLGIANTMLMSVYERTREIGTMMAVGVRRRQILVLFLVEAALVGLGGGVLGSLGGGLFVWLTGRRGIELHIPDMRQPLHIHPFIGPGYILFVLALATAGAVLAALWPSLRASRLRPVQALAAV